MKKLEFLAYKYLVLIMMPCFILFGVHKHNPDRGATILTSDQEGYYVYLPALFIHGSFKDLPYVNGCSIPDSTSGMVYTKYTYGVALLELPFFIGAHTLAKAIEAETDGRSPPYRWSILIAALFYLTIAIHLLKKLLSRWFLPRPVVLSIVCIGLGTNLFYYSTAEPGMSHVYGFFLVTCVISLLSKWCEKPLPIVAVGMSIVISIAILVRPTNAILLILLPLWKVNTWEGFKHRTRALITTGTPVMIIAITAALYYPQLKYWGQFTGDFFTYSYGNEGFKYWNSPRVFQVLFSHQNGLFMYSPILLLAVFGLIPLWRQKPALTFPVSISLVLATYAFASWWAWWFGGAFGHRAFIEFLPLMAIPMAAFWTVITERGKILKAAFASVALLLIFANLRMSKMYYSPWDGPDWTINRFIEVWTSVFQFT